MGEGDWCPSVLYTPSLPSNSSPWYLSRQQEKVTMLFFLAPSPSFLPQSKFVLFDLNTYLWLWTRESGGLRGFTPASSAVGQ